MDAVWCPVHLSIKIGKNNRAVPWSLPADVLNGLFTSYLLMKTPGEVWAAASTHRRPYMLWKLPGVHEIGREPYRHRAKMAKISIFTRRTGHLVNVPCILVDVCELRASGLLPSIGVTSGHLVNVAGKIWGHQDPLSTINYTGVLRVPGLLPSIGVTS